MVPYSPLNRKAVVAAIFGDKDMAFFWESRFLARWLPLLLGLGLGLLLATLIANEAWYLIVPVALAVPAIVLFNRYPFVAVMAWMLLLPYFLSTPTAAERAIYWILHRAIIPAALGVAILSDWLGIRRRETIRLGRAELAMLAFLGLTMSSIFLLNQNPVQSTIELYDRLFVPFCAYWLIRLTAPTEKDLKRFLWVAFITLVAQCAIGLLSWFAPQVLPPQWIGRTLGERTVGSLRNVAVYTSTLLFLALLLFQYAMNCRSKRMRYIILGAFGLALFCVFFSFSRGSWLGALMVLVGLTLIYPKPTIRLIIIVVALVYVLSSNILASEVAWGYERLTGEASQRSADSRVIVSNALVGMIRTKPFFGWGYNNYKVYCQQFITRVGNISATKGYNRASHNTYLTIMAELGVTALVLYLFPVGWWLMLSIKIRRRLPQEGFGSWRLLAMLWLLMLHMFIVTNFMDMVRHHPFGTTVWWMALGLIANVVYPYLRPDDIGASNWTGQAFRRT